MHGMNEIVRVLGIPNDVSGVLCLCFCKWFGAVEMILHSSDPEENDWIIPPPSHKSGPKDEGPDVQSDRSRTNVFGAASVVQKVVTAEARSLVCNQLPW